MATVNISRANGDSTAIEAVRFGNWAVHNSVCFDYGDVSITYVPSGYRIDNLIGWAADDHQAAERIARTLHERCVDVPEEKWGACENRRDVDEFVRVIEGIAAEVLDSLLDERAVSK